MYICLCKSVTDSAIREAVDMGMVSYDDVKSSLSVGTGCGTCRCEVDRVIEERLQQSGSAHSHHNYSAVEIKLAP